MAVITAIRLLGQANASHLQDRAWCRRADLKRHEEAVGTIEAQNVCFAHLCER